MPAPRKNLSLKQLETQAKAACFDWNNKYPAGVLVSYESIIGRGETHRGRTRGEAMVQPCEAVIFIDGKSGFVSLDHCTVLEQPAVFKVALVDSGQDFTEWYIRDGIVIDCQPGQGRVWVGTKVLNMDALGAGATIEMIAPVTGEATILNHQVESVAVLQAKETAEVEGYGREWAKIKGVPPSSLGL